MTYYTPDELIRWITDKSAKAGTYEPVANSATFLLDAAQKLQVRKYRPSSQRLCFRRKPYHLRGKR